MSEEEMTVEEAGRLIMAAGFDRDALDAWMLAGGLDRAQRFMAAIDLMEGADRSNIPEYLKDQEYKVMHEIFTVQVLVENGWRPGVEGADDGTYATDADIYAAGRAQGVLDALRAQWKREGVDPQPVTKLLQAAEIPWTDKNPYEE